MREAASVPGEIAVVPDTRPLGKFTLLEQIGEGGMARIYLARARGIGGFEKLVVVKQILPRLAEDAEFIARFFQEARLAATLDHPNIAAVYDVDSDRDTYFYSMEYVRGRDLQKVLRRAKQVERVLSLDEIVAVVTNLCAGLHHAHTRAGSDGRPLGIVHRDVSPSNVLLSFEGAVKLADFGVAKARTGMVSTVAGTLRGKIAYMSPEQCRGESLDRRSDVYAVGVLMWEMLTSQRLHHGESELGIVRQIAERSSPSPRAHRPDLPEALERIVAKALALEPANRYASAHALQAELEEHARTTGLAVSARTIAALMGELFPDQAHREPPAARIAATMPIRVDDVAQEDRITPATATFAPPRLPPAELAPSLVPSLDGDEPTRDLAPTASRGWTGMAVGLALGIALGGGGLWLALDRTRPTDSATEADAGVSDAATRAATPTGEREPATPSAEPDAPDEPTAATPPAEPAAREPSVPTAAASTEAPRTASPTSRARRKTKRRRADGKPKAINLDSPLPPGFDAG
jgi:tRNA A-37 threonylcarbamoyl transferase component Bud32